MRQTEKEVYSRHHDSFPAIAIGILIILVVVLFSPEIVKLTDKASTAQETVAETDSNEFDILSVPAYSSSPYAEVNENTPYFSARDIENAKSCDAFERYGELDSLGRCTEAYCLLGKETMPVIGEERGDISSVTPTGWNQKAYDCIVCEGNEEGFLMNRTHLAAWCLTAENARNTNLIAGTYYMNTSGMWPFEEQVQQYILETGNHVLYRVTPIFSGLNLMASGVLMEAQSIEDGGDGISFCVYCYNVQPGIEINYLTGNSIMVGQ